MKALRLGADGTVAVHEVTISQPAPGEAQIQVIRAGICGTDVLASKRPSGHLPITLGHECIGRVASVGSAVTDLKPGTVVIPEGGWSCGSCGQCLVGKESVCSNRESLGRTVNGVFAEYVNVPSRACHSIDPATSAQDGQAVVTVATILRSIDRSGLAPSDSVAVIGTGHAGLLFIQLLTRRFDVQRIISLGTRTNRLDMAREFGAQDAINVRSPAFGDIEKKWQLGQGIVDLVFEASGTIAGMRSARALVRPGGTIVPYSIFDSGSAIKGLDEFYRREITIRGTRGGTGFYESAIAAVEAKEVVPSMLAACESTLSEGAELFAAVRDKTIDTIRAVLIP